MRRLTETSEGNCREQIGYYDEHVAHCSDSQNLRILPASANLSMSVIACLQQLSEDSKPLAKLFPYR